MIDPNPATEIPLHCSQESEEPRRAVYPALLVAAGVILAGFHVPHLLSDVQEGMGLLALVTGAVFPFLLAVIIAAAGYRLWQSDVRVAQLRRIDQWFCIGIAAITVMSGSFVVYQLLEGAHLTHIPFTLLNFATAGGIGGILVGWYDAQNRRRAAQLRVFQRLVEDGGHSICLTGPDGTIEYVNSAFEDQTGYDQAEAIGKNPRILKSGEQDDRFYAEMWETIRAGDVWHHELVNARKDGTTYDVDQTIAPVTDGDGTIEHFAAINVDISERKRYERELERQNERLDEFASVISHDLRNPLNVAINRVELARRECDNDHLAITERSLDRMAQLIEDVLTLTRQGDKIGETQRASLRSLSEAAWHQIDADDATLSVRTDRSLTADPGRLQQLLENLFRNAVEHGSTSPQEAGDAVEHSLTNHRSQAPEDAVEHGSTNPQGGEVLVGDHGGDLTIRVGDCAGGFYVEDTGTGFPDDLGDRVFESGFTTADDGTGLGLAIVERIVEAHGWSITATTGTDGGARFEITVDE